MFKEEVFLGKCKVTGLGLGVLIIGESFKMRLPLNEDMVVIENHVIQTILWVHLWGVDTFNQYA